MKTETNYVQTRSEPGDRSGRAASSRDNYSPRPLSEEDMKLQFSTLIERQENINTRVSVIAVVDEPHLDGVSIESIWTNTEYKIEVDEKTYRYLQQEALWTLLGRIEESLSSERE